VTAGLFRRIIFGPAAIFARVCGSLRCKETEMATYKVGYFVGSLAKGSINRLLAKALVRLAPPELELTEIPIKDLPLYSYDYDADYPPVAKAFKEAIASVDAVLFVTPEYNRSIPGGLKNAIDWASRPYGLSAIVGKPAGVISASTGSFGGRWAQEEVRKALRLSGAAMIGEGLAVGKAAERLVETGEADEEILNGIDDVLRQLAAKVAEMQRELETSDV
jgi:chromate reductase, NAD(P)H dehydrogenase (quinone)